MPPSESTSKLEIAVFCPYFLGGGAEAVCLWILQALIERYSVTLYTLTGLDLVKMNRMYDTNLPTEKLKVVSLFSRKWELIIYSLMANNPACKNFFVHLIIKRIKQECHNYAACFSAFNAVDMGRPSLQYLHYIGVIDNKTQFYKLSDFSEARLRENTSLANSGYVAKLAEAEYGSPAAVVYPPVPLPICHDPWSEKENAFICSGRLTDAKAPHRVIKILKKVRDRGHAVKLYLTGGGGGVYAWKYQRFLAQQVAENSDWVTLYRNLSYKDYIQLMTRCRYGIHFKREPFGISVAEMVRSGAITFVRYEGGQLEIVGPQNQDLIFIDEDDAANKICQVMAEPERQKRLLYALAKQQPLFSSENFMLGIQTSVARFLEIA